MNRSLNLVNAAICKIKIKTNILVFVLMIFVAVAMTQTFQLGNMLSEAKSIGQDINGMRAEQQILREQYSFYGNNLSYYFSD